MDITLRTPCVANREIPSMNDDVTISDDLVVTTNQFVIHFLHTSKRPITVADDIPVTVMLIGGEMESDLSRHLLLLVSLCGPR